MKKNINKSQTSHKKWQLSEEMSQKVTNDWKKNHRFVKKLTKCDKLVKRVTKTDKLAKEKSQSGDKIVKKLQTN